MNRALHSKNRGFSLIELTVALLIVVLLAGIALRSTNELSFQVRYEQTQERLNRIKEAIIGNPHRTVNGQPDISGFVADMGRLPSCLRELITNFNCATSNPNLTWVNADAPSHLSTGWRGPYLTVANNPNDVDAFTDGWGNTSTDGNYGWNFDLSTAPDLILRSRGKNQILNAGDTNYDQDYPVNQPYINASDWRVDIGGGLNVSFIKSYGSAGKKLPPLSFCTDPAQNTKSACTTASKTWYGGCDHAGYFNKDSCMAASPPGSWEKCSDGGSTTKTACENSGNHWYGEGYGCSVQTYTNKTDCLNSGKVWRGCTDDGTITDIATCFSHNEIWYGNDLYNIPVAPYSGNLVCMKIFYRKADASIGVLTSDENTSNDSPTVHYDPKPITEDGSFQTLRFAAFRNMSGNLETAIPIGINAIGIYQYDGSSCVTSGTLYPDGRTQPVQVLFSPHANLAAINW